MKREIYMKPRKIKLGESSTAKVITTEDYYQAVEVDEGHVEMRLLDFTDHPLGGAIVIHKDQLREYIHCPDYIKNKERSKDIVGEEPVQSKEEHFQEGNI